MRRVIIRRSHGGSRMSRKPSITIWPASVPVIVEFCPEASSATAKSVLAAVVPSSGASRSVRVADVGHALVCRWPWKVAAARIRIAALMKNAKSSATVESRVAKRIASRFDAGSVPHLPRLHDGRVQVEVVRHHRGAQDADGDVEHRGIA